MIVLAILATAAVALGLGIRFYAPHIARVLGERADRVTPAVAVNDGRDYVPTRTPVVFAHHYASIAGAGPIVGPVIALLYGWGPALVWIILGGIFLGAVHDYVCTYISVREGGKNLTVIARRYIGPGAFVMLLVLLVLLLTLVCAAFLDLSAKALTSMVSLDVLQMDPEQTLFRIVDGKAVIGGIASTSVVVITACSPLIGFMYLKRKTPVWICSLLAMAICVVSIAVGLKVPMAVEPSTWKLMISGYVLVSAGLPVWLFLQSRDFINVHVLYLGIVFLVVAIVAAALRGGGHVGSGEGIPFNNWGEASAKLGPGWPVMFVIIACGAVSGFHGLCAGGTTAKQLDNEPATRRVGYYGMVLESFLAVCVVICLVVGLTSIDYVQYCHPQGAKANAVLTFAMAVGHTANIGLGLPIAAGALGAMLLLEGFLVTTLDTAIRLTRYMIEEGWATFFGRYDVFVSGDAGPAGEPSSAIRTSGVGRVLLGVLKHYWVNSGIAVALMLAFGWGSGYKVLWKVFGSSNQLLAALALLIGSCWLYRYRRPVGYTLIPALLMLVTATWALIRLVVQDLPSVAEKAPLVIAELLVLLMTVGIVFLVLVRWQRMRTELAEAVPAD